MYKTKENKVKDEKHRKLEIFEGKQERVFVNHNALCAQTCMADIL
jgi:hypothetical protein